MVYAAYPLALVSWLGKLGPWLFLPWITTPLALDLVRIVRTHTDGPSLNDALARTGMLQLGFCLLLSAGILLS